jgi:hypothetical protein
MFLASILIVSTICFTLNSYVTLPEIDFSSKFGYKEAVHVKKSTYFVCCEKEKMEKSRKNSAFIN